MAKKIITPTEEMELIRSKMKHFRLEWTPEHFLDTGSKRLNSVLGIRDKGIPAGKILEFSGPESSGKSGLAQDIVAIAQKQGWNACWHDQESTLHKKWIKMRGVDWDKLARVEPYDGYFGKSPKLDAKGKPTTPPERASAEQLCDEAETWIKRKHRAEPDVPIIYVMDSVTALVTAYELNQSISEGNMRTKMSLSSFLSGLLRRWVGLFQTHNVLGIFINQLRVDPNKMFGNPETTTGGKALKFYSHVRVRVGRAGEAKSRMMDRGQQIGIKSIIKNRKNKTGGIENKEVGYKMFFDGSYKICSVEDIKSKGEVV
jgi:recombination protein RecA